MNDRAEPSRVPQGTGDLPSSPFDVPKRWLFRRFGWVGLALVISAGLIWWNWDKIRTLPGITPLLQWIGREQIPTASAERFAIAVAHLENDTDGKYETLIVQALVVLPWIEVHQYNHTITLGGSRPQEQVAAGHEAARKYLAQSKDHVLIWGILLQDGDRSIPKLYWTTADDSTLVRSPGKYSFTDELDLPLVFWEDLSEVLHLVVVTTAAGFADEEGHFVADRLAPFITRVGSLLERSDTLLVWDAASRAGVEFILAYSLTIFGDQSGTNEPLERAVALFRQVLGEYTRERVPLSWAMTQNNLGNTLEILGGRESGTARLEEAISAYREALKEFTRERVPLDWAAVQNNIGDALTTLGERESGTARLDAAVTAYRETLKEYTRERFPLDWAATQSGLAIALQRLGERETGTTRLEEAVSAYREALKETTRERVPLDWAATQNNLGGALQTLGEREAGTGRLEEAVAAYQEALKERTRERVPLKWATTQNNLGNALAALGERELGTARLNRAVTAYREALKERTRERVPLDWAATQSNLATALQVLGERESGTTRLEEAVTACREALKEWTRERVPLKWATMQNNVGNSLATLGERRQDPIVCCEALGTHLACWEEFADGDAPHWARIAARNVRRDLMIISKSFPTSAVVCLEKHADLLSRWLAAGGLDPDTLGG